jgi:polysaccharide deacetylase 2 family uncharacterized protein YibQ
MDRRNFLFKSAAFLAGSLFGFNGFSRAFAQETQKRNLVRQPRIALIIDDIGFSFSVARQFLDIGVPLTFSILPKLPDSRNLALEIHANGHEIMLHQPMEPRGAGVDPGPGALYTGFAKDKITKIMEDNLSSLPPVTGVNNHMGSRFTESHKEISETLNIIKKKGLFFVDSLTSCRSKAFTIARSFRMTTTYRNVFLDNVADEIAILAQLHCLENHARRFGHAVGIGHPFPETIRAIAAFSRNLAHSGLSLVHISRIFSAQN